MICPKEATNKINGLAAGRFRRQSKEKTKWQRM